MKHMACLISKVKRLFVIVRDDSIETVTLAKQIKKSVKSKGGECDYYIMGEDVHMDGLNLPDGVECILTIGGDGTMIRAAQNTFGSNIPLLGINCGHMGYLCDLDKDSVFGAIDRLLNDDYQIEKRMMLQGSVESEGTRNDNNRALNDIIIRSTQKQHVTRLSVYVNDKHLFAYDCDGIIISTPTGSTAYNLSAHGPIVNPETNLILLTPINPHTLNARSIILDPDDEVSVKLIPRTINVDEKAIVTFDGKHERYLRADGKLTVKRAEDVTNMVMLSSENFLYRIRNKLSQ